MSILHTSICKNVYLFQRWGHFGPATLDCQDFVNLVPFLDMTLSKLGILVDLVFQQLEANDLGACFWSEGVVGVGEVMRCDDGMSQYARNLRSCFDLWWFLVGFATGIGFPFFFCGYLRDWMRRGDPIKSPLPNCICKLGFFKFRSSHDYTLWPALNNLCATFVAVVLKWHVCGKQTWLENPRW